MSEHLSAQHVQQYRQGTLGPAERSEAEAHLAACEACRRRLRETEPLQAVFTAVRADLQAAASAKPVHLPYDQLASYVDNTLGDVDRQIVEGHLEGCAQCMAEVRDLRTLQAAIATYPDEASALVPPPSLWQRSLAFWRSPAHWIPLQAAGTAAVAALLVWLATRPLQTQVADLRAEMSRLRQTNDALQKQVAAIAGLRTQVAQLQQENRQIRRDYQTAQAAAARLQTQLAQLQQPKTPNQPALSPPVVLALNDGGRRVTLDKQGDLAGLPPLPPPLKQTVRTTLAARQVKTPPWLTDLIDRPGVLLSGSGQGVAFALHSPVGTVVSADRPTFRWQPLPGATRYRVAVYDTGFPVPHEAAGSDPLTKTAWQVPHPLPRGKVYSWQVTAFIDGKAVTSPAPPAPEAKFKVLEQTTANALERAKQRYADSPLLLGILYAQAGLLDDAEREFQALQDANPQSPVAQKLLGSVRSLRRDTR